MKHLNLYESVEEIGRLGSIRAAAESLSITSTALNRQIIALEDELGQPIFERLPRGVRLNTAGEMFLIHAREHLRDYDRLKSQLADLSGIRRGHVTIATTKAAMPYFLPQQIHEYQAQHPGVSFKINPCDIETALVQVTDMQADMAMVFEPMLRREFEVIDSIQQEVVVLFAKDHPLAKSRDSVRLSECLQYQLALPADVTGVRSLLERAVQRSQQSMMIAIESEDSQFLLNTTRLGELITFDIPLGLSRKSLEKKNLSWRKIDRNDINHGRLYLGQLKNRNLSVAAFKFASQITIALQKQNLMCD